MRYSIVGNTIADNQAGRGDCVCVAPIELEMSRSQENWPENARRIVALLNLAESAGLSTEEIERRLAVHSNLPKMEIPGDRVEFSDDVQRKWTGQGNV